MLNSKTLAALLLMMNCLCVSAYADTSQNTLTVSLFNNNMNSGIQHISASAFKNKLLVINSPKTPKIKAGIVFTPEDLVTVSYKHSTFYHMDNHFTSVENSDRIIGFYLKRYF